MGPASPTPTPLPPNWAEQLTAHATVVYALAAVLTLLVLAIAAVVGYQQVKQTVRSRHAATLAEISRRWDDPFLTQSRREAASLGEGENLRDWIAYLIEEHDDRFYSLERIPNFFEDLAVLEKAGAISFDMVKLSLGGVIVSYWESWREAAMWMRDTEGYDPVYENWERLAERMRTALKRYELKAPDTEAEPETEVAPDSQAD